MTLILYLVRHGQTLFNERDLVQGWVDSPLTELGVAQARRTAAELAGRPLSGLYSSTSERAEDTAELIGEFHPGVSVQRMKGLKELHFGALEATPNENLTAGVDLPSFFTALLAGHGEGVPGGESGEQFMGRVSDALSAIVAAHPSGSEVVVVSHGVTINALLFLAGWDSPGPLENASISIVGRDSSGAFDIHGVGLQEIPKDLPGAVAHG